MAAAVYDIRSVGVLPDSVYVDTTVLYGAFLSEIGDADARERAGAAFLRATEASITCSPWTSLLAVQEACWLPLSNALKNAAPRRTSLKDLCRLDPLGYQAAYGSGRSVADDLLCFLARLRIAIRGPRTPSGQSARAGRAVCTAVRALMHRYELEMADLFHIALAKLDGTSAIATLDAGYRDVDGIEVYTVP